MATKAQREAQKSKRQNKKRRKAKLREKRRANESPATRFQMRLAKQTIRIWDGECAEDRAVIDDESLLALSPDLAAQARVIRTALAVICAGESQQALEPLTTIPRNSPFAAWRLFLRGLVAWQNEDIDTAQQSWSRLDSERRPGRIATTMMLAHRDDLDSLSPLVTKPDPELLYHAKLLRRVRIDRSAIRAARAGVQVPEEFDDITIGPRRISWLREFTKEYQGIEPDLVQSLHKVARCLAYCGNYVDMFSEVTRHFGGPSHDRNNALLTFFFESTMGDHSSQEKAKQALDKYLTVDLPGNKELSPQLRDALISQIHLNEAIAAMKPPGPAMGDMFSMFNNAPDPGRIEHHFEQSIEAYPKNRLAYESYVSWTESLIDEDMKKAGRDQLAAIAAEVRHRWTQALPGDIDPRLNLVDYLLENDKSDEAKSHVDFLSGVRQDNPLARATQWKWHLLEAMRLCRRKAWLAQVPHQLDEAGKRWPSWLSNTWLPYLHAAHHLRCGDREGCRTDLVAGRSTGSIVADSLQDACMMLAAAQRMRVPSADLKPLRRPVDRALQDLRSIELNDLLSTASFFWDLSRVNLLYPAFRMHGIKFLRELLKRFAERPSLVHSDLDNPLIQSALFEMSEQGLFNDKYSVKLPNWLDKEKSKSHMTLVATEVNAVLNRRVSWGVERYANHVPLLREASSQVDAFYRHWYSMLADDLEEAIRKSDSPGFGVFGSMFDDIYERMDEGNPECDCDECRAARGEI